MNATCPAGILKPQRVSDLGRLLNPEITAPARPHSTWCLQHQHGACPSARRPLQHPHGAWPSARRPLSTSSPTARAARLARLHKTDDARCASRSAQRRRSFPSPSTGKFSSLPSITISVTPCRTTRKPDDGARRDFACTSTWPHDGALPKHGAPRAATTENDARQWPRGKPTKTTNEKTTKNTYETQLR